MKAPIHFFHGNTLLGSSAIKVDLEKHSVRPLSVAYFCPECGELWARALITGHRWEVWHILCPKHELPYPFRVPGSMWLEWERTLNDSFPPALLAHEVQLHLAIYDRFKEMYHAQ